MCWRRRRSASGFSQSRRRPQSQPRTRPKYAKVNGGDVVPDKEMVARFEPYGRYAGLAFWLYLTQDWVP